MKNLLILLFVLSSNFLSAQENIFIETFYKKVPNQNLSKELFSFSFLQKEGLIIKKNMGTGIEKKYKVEFDNGSYSEDGKYYFLTYVTDEKKSENSYENNDFGRFVIQYDIKKTNILAVKIKLNNAYYIDTFLTEKGNETLSL